MEKGSSIFLLIQNIFDHCFVSIRVSEKGNGRFIKEVNQASILQRKGAFEIPMELRRQPYLNLLCLIVQAQ